MKVLTLFALHGLTTFVFALPATNPRWSKPDLQSRESRAYENLQGQPLDDNLFVPRSFDNNFGLDKRDYQDIESRQIGVIKDPSGDGLSVLERNKKLREAFARNTVKKNKAKFPQYNWVACHVKHSTDFKGTRGTDWGHFREELELERTGNVGYDIYWFREGTFRRQGDGGYINWAYIGKVLSSSNNGATVVFGRP